jgi:hypothetical protein
MCGRKIADCGKKIEGYVRKIAEQTGERIDEPILVVRCADSIGQIRWQVSMGGKGETMPGLSRWTGQIAPNGLSARSVPNVPNDRRGRNGRKSRSELGTTRSTSLSVAARRRRRETCPAPLCYEAYCWCQTEKN